MAQLPHSPSDHSEEAQDHPRGLSLLVGPGAEGLGLALVCRPGVGPSAVLHLSGQSQPKGGLNSPLARRHVSFHLTQWPPHGGSL